MSELKTPWSTVGYLTYKRTYSRELDPATGKTEEFEDTIYRVIDACKTQLKIDFTTDEEYRLFDYLFSLKASVAGRFLWQMGTQTVERFGLASLQNCAFTVIDHPVSPFCWAMDMLALGAGVGYNLQRKHVDKLPKVRKWFKAPTRTDDAGADFIIPDSREGWVKFLGKTLKAAFLSETPEKGTFTFSTQVVRGKGEPIKGFGGVACLTGDTLVYKDRKKSEEQNSITIEELYDMQNSEGFYAGKPNHFNKVKLRSLDEKTGVFYRNKVIQVIDNGFAPVYELKTRLGYKIKATNNHRFMDACGDYVFLENMSVGDWIAVNGSYTRISGHCIDCGKSIYYTAIRCVDCNNLNQIKDNALDSSARERKERKIYSKLHDRCEKCGLKVIDTDKRFETHHLDQNPHNNDHCNLMFLCSKCHQGIHAETKNIGDAYRHRYVSYDEIVSIEYIGIEKVYDLEMEAPDHNFIANGFVSHNSGPNDLCWGINEISKILDKKRGKKIRPIDALDIMNIIGHIIVAGNVRRSAQIAIGDPDDVEFLLAKRWDMGIIPKWRAMSNNSVACDNIEDLHEFFWQGYEGRGESYGLINLPLLRSCGRLGETQYPDPLVEGTNPCGEQGLEKEESCCLSEVYLPNVTSYPELLDILELFYRICKHSLRLPSHQPGTETVVHKNMRMGIGMTGVLQATEEQRGWLRAAYEHLRAFDVEYSEEHGFPVSIKLTTVKPSGTLSLLPGVTPGIHAAIFQYMLRRIQIASESPLVEVCKQHGYNVEYKLNIDGTIDPGTVVVEFPYSYPEGTKLAKDMTAIDQLKEVERMQRDWSDNSVSCTIYYRKEELPEIKEYLAKHYKNTFKTLSFLLHTDSGFLQQPYEEITKERYGELMSKVKVISSIDNSVEYESNDECASGMCPLR